MAQADINKLGLLGEQPSDLVREHRGYYLIVNAVAKRVRALQTGDKALALPPDGVRDPIRIALQELAEEKLEITSKPHSHRLVDVINRSEDD